MPRKRNARSEEIQTNLGAASQRLVDSLFSRRAPAVLRRYMRQLECEYSMCEVLLRARKDLPKKKLKGLLTIDRAKLFRNLANVRLTIEDVDAVREELDRFTAVMTGKVDKPVPSTRLFKTMGRLLSPPKPKAHRYRPEFVTAFRRSWQAEQSGQVIPASKLAQELLPDAYRTNPESTIRGLQKAIVRVKQAHERCVAEGIDSPFLPPRVVDPFAKDS